MVSPAAGAASTGAAVGVGSPAEERGRGGRTTGSAAGCGLGAPFTGAIRGEAVADLGVETFDFVGAMGTAAGVSCKVKDAMYSPLLASKSSCETIPESRAARSCCARKNAVFTVS